MRETNHAVRNSINACNGQPLTRVGREIPGSDYLKFVVGGFQQRCPLYRFTGRHTIQQVVFQLALTAALNPLADPVGIAKGCQFAKGIEQHNGEVLTVNFSLHHEAASCLVQVTGLAEPNVPVLVF